MNNEFESVSVFLKLILNIDDPLFWMMWAILSSTSILWESW